MYYQARPYEPGWCCWCGGVGCVFFLGEGGGTATVFGHDVDAACAFMTVSTLPVLESTESYVIQTALRCDVA